jgi:aminomethyltransferase
MPPRRTALYDRHRALGARLVDFAGWEMPVSYRGALEEHRAVRERCGLFDVSHMGEVEVRGPGAAALCDRLTVNDVSRLADGDGQYSIFCDVRGGVIDDLIVYRLEAEAFLLVVNAANTTIDLDWIREHRSAGADVIDRSSETGLLALQGPSATAVLGAVTRLDLGAVKPFSIHETTVADARVRVARTGYTGEDGFEVFVATDRLTGVWDVLLAAMARVDGLACGLAARDTLRLEAALPLCGADIDRTTTPLEAGLGWVVKLGKGAFVGCEALRAQHEAGVRRRLVGIEMDEPGVPRHGQAIFQGDAEVGAITSGTRSPTLGRFIALGYVPREHSAVDTRLAVDVRGRRHPAHVVPKPFYRRARGGKRSSR